VAANQGLEDGMTGAHDAPADAIGTSSPERIGFVGIGKMGWPMARLLATAGYRLTVHDAERQRQSAFADEHGCSAAVSADEFEDASVVVTMLPDDRHVRSALLEWDGGIASSLAREAVVVDMSSSDPRGTTALGEALARRGVDLVDAPVSGGVTRAEAGTLTVMIGADSEAAVARALPVLEVLGERLFRTGPLGSGHAMKALNNFVGGTAYVAVVEALAIGRRFGLAPTTMIDVMNASSGRSFNTEHVVKDHVLTGSYATGFALGLLAKDVGIAAALASAAEVDAPLTGLVSRRWAEAADDLGGDVDHTEAHKHWWPGRPLEDGDSKT
jgi:3-hydroxyisobutyrate dehydrogenase